MFLEELFEGPFLKSGLHKIQRKFDRTGEYIDPKAQADKMQARVDAIQAEVGPNEYMQGALDRLRSSGDPEKAELADKIEDNYYNSEIGISGVSPHERDVMMQTGMKQWQADRAERGAMTDEERAAYVEQQKKKAEEERNRKKAEKKKRKEEKAKEKAEAEAERCKNPNALMCP